MMIKKVFLLSCLIMGLPTVVFAGLGAGVDSFQNNATPVMVLRHAVNGTANSASINYSTQQMQDDVGNTITEYMTTNGIVFALTWRGLFKPDLNRLLGSYFKTYLAVEGKSSVRQTQIVNQDAVVVVSEGHLRNFHGHAYIPGLVPVGFSLGDLK
jgi:hypothetical protein